MAAPAAIMPHARVEVGSAHATCAGRGPAACRCSCGAAAVQRRRRRRQQQQLVRRIDRLSRIEALPCMSSRPTRRVGAPRRGPARSPSPSALKLGCLLHNLLQDAILMPGHKDRSHSALRAWPEHGTAPGRRCEACSSAHASPDLFLLSCSIAAGGVTGAEQTTERGL